MTYRAEITPLVRSHLATMPKAARDAYEEMLKRIKVDPWDGSPVADNPLANLKQTAFGNGRGLAVYLIQDREEVVTVVRLLWA